MMDDEQKKAFIKRWRTFETLPGKKLEPKEVEGILTTLSMTVDDKLFKIGGMLAFHIAYLEEKLREADVDF